MKIWRFGILDVLELGFGCMSISDNYGFFVDKEKGIKIIYIVYEKGVMFFDIVEVYGLYINEELVGEVFVFFCDEVIIVSKFGFDIEGLEGFNSWLEYIKKVVEDLFKCFKMDWIDFYY